MTSRVVRNGEGHTAEKSFNDRRNEYESVSKGEILAETGDEYHS